MTVVAMNLAVRRHTGEWRQPLPLPSALPDVPEFIASMLPAELQPWAVDIADRMQVPLDFVAIPAMVAAGALIGSRIGVCPERNTNWAEPANLWGCIVGPPGSLKSPAMSEVLAPIRRLEMQAAADNEAILVEHGRQSALARLHRDAAEAEAKKHLRGGDKLAAKLALAEVEDPQPPKLKRFLTSDATVEKLGEICAANPSGILVHRDELLTLFADLDREERAPARGFYLLGWKGDESYTFDRIGRGTIRADTVNLSVIGTTQPNRLPRYLAESFKQHDDGMVQRLQMLTWPDISKVWTSRDVHPDLPAKTRAFECYSRLATFDPISIGAQSPSFGSGAKMPYLRFAEDAVDLFLDWRTNILEPKVRGEDLTPQFAAHLSKYRGLVPRLALINHLASGDTGPVSRRAVLAALAWAEYLEAHAARAYASLARAETDVASAIIRRIMRGDLKNGFTDRDVYRNGWSGLTNRESVAVGLKLLEDYDWLASERVSTGGRPSSVWYINPAVVEDAVAAAA